MPTVLIQNGYRVSFYSYDLAEPMHVHVFKAGHECKVWFRDFSVAFNHGFKPKELSEILQILTEHRSEIVNRWLEHGRQGN
jgi:hypothetical protein